MNDSVLMVTAMTQAEICAEALTRELGLTVEVAATRKAALLALRRREYSIILLDEGMIEADPAGTDLLWKQSGLAFPMQVNFAISNGPRLVREVRAAMARRTQEHAVAVRAAARILESELKSTVSGLLLQSQLALAEPALPPKLRDKLKIIAELAARLRHQLENPRVGKQTSSGITLISSKSRVILS
jgi:hypothetical protein